VYATLKFYNTYFLNTVSGLLLYLQKLLLMPELVDKLAIESNLVNKLDKQSTDKLATEGITGRSVEGNISYGSSPTIIVNNLLASWTHVS